MKRVAIIVFYDNQKRILLQDRRNISKVGEEWGYFGGEIETGETKEEALQREIREELGYDLTEYHYLGQFQEESNNNLPARDLFIAPLKNDLNKFHLKEGKGMQLFSIAEARQLKMVPGDLLGINLIEKYLSTK